MNNLHEQALKHAIEQAVHEDMFPVVWHLIEQYPSAVATADLLAVCDGLDLVEERAVLDAALQAGILDRLIGDFHQQIASVSQQLVVFGLEIVEVEQFGYKIKCKETGE